MGLCPSVDTKPAWAEKGVLWSHVYAERVGRSKATQTKPFEANRCVERDFKFAQMFIPL